MLPGMVARDAGHVANMGPTAGEWPCPGGKVYGSATTCAPTCTARGCG